MCFGLFLRLFLKLAFLFWSAWRGTPQNLYYLYSSSQTILRFSQSVMGHFMTLHETIIGIHLSSYDPEQICRLWLITNSNLQFFCDSNLNTIIINIKMLFTGWEVSNAKHCAKGLEELSHPFVNLSAQKRHRWFFVCFFGQCCHSKS